MANPEHLDILYQGVGVWNQWRKAYPGIQPDLSGTSFGAEYLNGVNFSRTNLFESIFIEAELAQANLYEADLGGAVCRGVNFRGADLRRTDFRNAILRGSSLDQVSLEQASIGWTTLASIDLSSVKNLETVRHHGPSSIGIDTIYLSHGNLPEAFLKGAGVDDTFITYIRSLVGKPIEYHSCFISYSSKDDAFARRLYESLQSSNVRCWFAPEDLQWGAKIRTGIDEAIHHHDKLLLVLSKHSVTSGWVEHEVKTALVRERKEKRIVLFPVRLDNAVFESPLAWATEIRHQRNIGDFTRWKNYDDYQRAFERLLCDLKASS